METLCIRQTHSSSSSETVAKSHGIPDHPVPRWRAYHIRVPVCRDRHLYAYKTPPFPRNARTSDGSAFVNRERESPWSSGASAKLRRYLSSCIRPADKSPTRKGRLAAVTSRNSCPLSRDQNQDRATFLGLLPLLCHDLPARVLGTLARFSRENRITSPIPVSSPRAS